LKIEQDGEREKKRKEKTGGLSQTREKEQENGVRGSLRRQRFLTEGTIKQHADTFVKAAAKSPLAWYEIAKIP
jgi:hypothetical protein